MNLAVRLLRKAWCLTLVAVLAGPAVAEDEPVDLQLLLAVDVSSSVSGYERIFQREAHARALEDRMIQAMALSGWRKRISIGYMEWSGTGFQRVKVPFRVLSEPGDFDMMAASIRAIEDTPGDPMFFSSTAVGNAIAAGTEAMMTSGIMADRHVIDISGDGVRNTGIPVQEARDLAVASGITVNALPILLGTDGDGTTPLERFFDECVIGGEAAFVMAAHGYGDMLDTLREKMFMEIAWGLEDAREMHAARERARRGWSWAAPDAPRIVPATSIRIGRQPAPREKADHGPCDVTNIRYTTPAQ